MPMRLQVLFVALTLSLPACAQHGKYRIPVQHGVDRLSAGPRFPDALLLAQTDGAEEVGIQPSAGAPADTEKPGRLPSHALTREFLYKFLLAEIAGQRGNVRLASRAYLELAQSTRDPRVARRATEIAMYGRFGDIAAEAASVWLEIEPDSQQARQTLIATLVGNNKISDAKPLLQKLLAADKGRAGSLFLQLHPLLSRYPDKAAALKLIQELAQPYPGVAEAHLAVAQSAFGMENYDLAETELAEALRIKPDLEPAALLKAQSLQRTSLAKAAEYLKSFVALNPKARDARLLYARLLAADRHPKEARQEFQLLEKELPGNSEVVVMIGLLSMQMQDFAAAEAKLKRALELNYRDPDSLRFYLGQLAEERKQFDEALDYYSKVQSGEQAVPAATRYAMILGKQNRVDEARKYLQSLDVQNDQQKTMLIQAEAQVLREASQYQEAFDVVNGALDAQPDNQDLLYDVAMAAEKLNRIDVLERNLKRLIELKPDHAQAYNALGYTLADRNLRLEEAQGYIEKALTLSPNDAFILDSMGWVHYRQGRLDEGLDFLRRAYAQRQDPEIAAHLGEVMWMKGQKGEAEQLLRTALQDHPTNEELKGVVAKLLK
ncbi:MAG: tetratricopeptide repeat protein [Betaproteobacteria bacterium]|nr:tetratricopeptide repeat protein [Betaproteobacteria bacterium]